MISIIDIEALLLFLLYLQLLDCRSIDILPLFYHERLQALPPA